MLSSDPMMNDGQLQYLFPIAMIISSGTIVDKSSSARDTHRESFATD